MVTQLRIWRETAGLTATQAASAFGVKQPVYSRWETGSRRIPAERVASISAFTGLPRHVLRPDIFGPYENIQRHEYVQNAAVAK
jgi:DNA-binding transcriptional regulator YdaS (Cro superfamily)